MKDNAELIVALRRMWVAYGRNLERHGMDGDDTWTDIDHDEWQAAAGGVAHLLQSHGVSLD